MKKIIIAIAFAFSLATVQADTLTVCASGCDYTTIATAYAAAGAADMIELQEDRNEGLTISKNIGGLQSDGTQRRMYVSSNFQVLDFNNSGITQPVTITGLHIENTSSGHCLRINVVGAGFGLDVSQCKLETDSSGGDNLFYDNTDIPAASTVEFYRCWFTAANISAAAVNINEADAGMFHFENCVFSNCGASGIDFNDTASELATIYNCTFDNIGSVGIYASCPLDVQNCLFTNNVDDVSVDGSGDANDFTYCAFETEAAGFGANCLYSIDSADQYVVDGSNYHIKSASADVYNTGNTIGSVTVDYDGTSRPRNGSYEIGAYEYVGTVNFMLLGIGL